MLPADKNGNRPSVGCYVTACAQIMKYHNHPKRRVKSALVKQDVDYDWDNMLNGYPDDATERQRNAVASLMYDINRGWAEDPLANGKSMWTVF